MPLPPIEVEQVQAAWSTLAGVEQLSDLQVIARSDSPLCPKGWVGLLALQGTLTVVVPDDDQIGAARTAVAGLTPSEATTSEIAARFSNVIEVLGPAALFYPTAPFRGPRQGEQVDRASLDELDVLLSEAGAEDAGESGLGEITAPAFVLREGSTVVAACGWQAWPGGKGVDTAGGASTVRQALTATATAAAVAGVGGAQCFWRSRLW